MKTSFPRIDDGDCSPSLASKLRQTLEDLTLLFQKLRIDDAIIIGGGQLIKKHLSTTATWNPASVGSGAQTSTTVSLSGAALGDEVTCSFSLDLQLMQLTGYVSASDTVTVVLRNGTGSGIDLASGTLRVSVWQH